MQNTQYVYPIGTVLLVFVLLAINKRMSNENVDRIELGKIALLCGTVVYIVLQVNQSSSQIPVLSEPFISSLES